MQVYFVKSSVRLLVPYFLVAFMADGWLQRALEPQVPASMCQHAHKLKTSIFPKECLH